jgi:hypothetical protein
MIPDTATRVQDHTSPHLNLQIQHELDSRISAYKAADKTALINQRLEELDREWDVERILQTNFGALSLVGLALATKVNKRWLALAIGVPAFMVQHALQGWSPPLAVLRRLGIRTAKEINEERFALKSLRGDFGRAKGEHEAAEIYQAVKS